MPVDDDALRDPALAALADRLSQIVSGEVDQYQAAQGVRPSFLVILVGDQDFETCCDTDDFEGMFDAMTELSACWIERGIIEIEDDAAQPAPLRPN